MLACIRTVATFLVGFAIGAIFNLLLSSSLQLPTHDLAPALDDQWETKYEVKFLDTCGKCVRWIRVRGSGKCSRGRL